MFSDYQKELISDLGCNPSETMKLLLTLHNKEKYTVHYRNLKLYLSLGKWSFLKLNILGLIYFFLGLRLKKIHRVISFNQSQWLKVYIDFNSKKRKEAKNSFEKNFFKLMVNSFFGKTCENVRNYKDIKLVISETRLKKLTSKPTFHAFKIFHLNLAAVQLRRTTVKLMKPRYIGFSILEISKCLMYSFHYHAVKKRYPNAKLLMTDTDSFCYH